MTKDIANKAILAPLAAKGGKAKKSKEQQQQGKRVR